MRKNRTYTEGVIEINFYKKTIGHPTIKSGMTYYFNYRTIVLIFCRPINYSLPCYYSFLLDQARIDYRPSYRRLMSK